MTHEVLAIIIFSAIPIGFLHTLFGPDHYIPFIALSKANHWSMRKTVCVTLLCAIGHVLSAVLLGLLGILIGLSLTKINFIENWRGEVAAWLLIAFGLIYFVWSLRAIARKTHHHHHSNSTPWILFILFILGPCEPLIPLILYPAIQGSALSVLLVSLAFGTATIITMLSMVILSIRATHVFRWTFFEKYANALAGLVIFSVGIAIKVFNL